MICTRQESRYAHCVGYMDLCYSEDGKCLLTCGRDGDVRVWAGFDDNDPISHTVGEVVSSLCQTNDRLIVANESCVLSLTFPEGERDAILTKYSLPVTQIVSSPESDLIIIALQNLEIRVLNLKTNTVVKQLKGADGCPLGVSFCASDSLVAVPCGDGKLRIWNLDNENIVKEIECVPLANSFETATVLCRPSFLKVRVSSTLFAYPDDRKIVILQTKEWKQISSLECTKAEGPFTICEFGKPHFEHSLAAATTLGEIIIWKLSDKSVLHYSKHLSRTNICALAWSPIRAKEVAFGDYRGQLAVVTVHKENDSEDDEDASISQLQEFLKHNAEMMEKTPKSDDIDDDGTETESISHFLNDEDDEKRPGRKHFDEDDLRSVVSVAAVEKYQSPFQPGSTDFDAAGNRYLAWNAIGVIREMSSGVASTIAAAAAAANVSSIEIEFHDSTFHHSINVFNTAHYSMAALSKTAVVLAAQEPSLLQCTPLDSGSKSWTIALENSEEIICVAVSKSFVAVGTDLRLVRFFTTHGTQCGVFSIAGPIVSIVGNCQHRDTFLVAYHDSNSFLKLQMLEYLQSKFHSTDVLCAPLLSNSSLNWLGFTNQQHAPVLSDSTNSVRLFNQSTKLWIPILSSSNKDVGENQNVFVTEVDEQFGIRCVLYPKQSVLTVNNRAPFLTELKFSLPLLDAESEKSQLESFLLLNGPNSIIFESDEFLDLDDKKVIRNMLKLFTIACQADRESRAFELIQMNMFSNLKTLSAKYANQMGYPKLADKIMQTDFARSASHDAATAAPSSTSHFNDYQRAMNSITNHGKSGRNQKQACENMSQTSVFSNNNKNNVTFAASAEPVSASVSSLSSQKSSNPFLKRNQETIEHNPKKKMIAKLLNEAPVRTTEPENGNSNSTSKTAGGSTGDKAPATGAPSFFQWLTESRKEEFRKMHPDLDDNQIVVEALKKYKNSMLQKRNAKDDDIIEINHTAKKARFGQ